MRDVTERRRIIEAEPDVADLLARMDCVMQIRTNKNGLWHARARGSSQFAAAATAIAAMLAAADLVSTEAAPRPAPPQPTPVPRRPIRGLFDT